MQHIKKNEEYKKSTITFFKFIYVVELKKVKAIKSISGSKYSWKIGFINMNIVIKYNKIKPSLKFLLIKINIIIQDIKNEK